MSETRPTSATADGRVYLQLRKLARQTGRNTQELLRLYGLEGFLARLAGSRYADRLVLKGGVLLAAYHTRRPTRDVDLQARHLSADQTDVLAMVRDIADVALDDGLAFDATSATASTIREDDSYSGTRVRLEARLASARITIHVDVNVGDPIWPAPRQIVLPGLLDRSVGLVGYPLSMVYAEKLVTMLDRGQVNTRWRDFADVYALSGRHQVIANELRTSVERVAEYRAVPLAPLGEVLNGFPVVAQPRWHTWRRKQELAELVPESFAEILRCTSDLADPVLSGELREGIWDPAARRWSP